MSVHVVEIIAQLRNVNSMGATYVKKMIQQYHYIMRDTALVPMIFHIGVDSAVDGGDVDNLIGTYTAAYM